MHKLKILHIAPQNISGVPGQLVQAERKLGHDSRLVTLFRDPRNYYEDICLNLPFIDFPLVKRLKRLVSAPEKILIDNQLRIPEIIPPVWRPHSAVEKLLITWRDHFWQPILNNAIRQHRLDQFDVYQLDGGLDLTREPRFIPQMQAAGKKIITCYTGSDLRTRGVIPQIDALADAVVSVEFDHIHLHPRLQHVFFPFDASLMPQRLPAADGIIRIGHAPTNRLAKGSHIILPIVQQLAQRYPVLPVLIENLSYERALQVKRTCTIFVDQIGDLGYGINALESIAMGIPTCTCLVQGFAEKYPDHPFVEVNAENLQERLTQLVEQALHGSLPWPHARPWLNSHHDPVKVVQRIHHIAGIN